MGVSGISPGSLLLIFLIVVVLFGSKKLQGLGEDLGKAFKGFRKGFSNPEESSSDKSQESSKDN
jgi:sec-independent protein translocase protein TatA